MPRKKGEPPQYTSEDLLKAVAELRNGDCSLRAIAHKYNIPKSTLCDKNVEKYNTEKTKPGPSMKLLPRQEERLKEYILHMSRIGKGVPKKDIPHLVQEIFKSTGHSSTFKNDLPSSFWTYSFLERNPELTARMPEHLGHQRKVVSEDSIRNWFEGLKQFLKSEHDLDAISFLSPENGDRIFNVDESGFPLAGGKKLKVIAEKGRRNVYQAGSDTKEQITVLACISATGYYANPYVIFKGPKPRYNLSNVNPDDYTLGNSDSGWMTTDNFFTWISSVFYPDLIKRQVSFPVLIFLDGHTSHINICISEFCLEHKIILYLLPPHASHLIQPLDVGVFGPVKKRWNDKVYEFNNKYNSSLNKSNFFTVFDATWAPIKANAQYCISAFRACGLVPYNPNALDYSKCINISKSKASFDKNTGKKAINYHQRLGIAQSIAAIERIIPKDMLDTYKSRNSSDADLYPTDYLWLSYLKLHNLMNGSDGDTSEDSNECIDNQLSPRQSPADKSCSSDMSYIAIPSTSTNTPAVASISVLQLNAINEVEIHEVIDTGIQIDVNEMEVIPIIDDCEEEAPVPLPFIYDSPNKKNDQLSMADTPPYVDPCILTENNDSTPSTSGADVLTKDNTPPFQNDQELNEFVPTNLYEQITSASTSSTSNAYVPTCRKKLFNEFDSPFKKYLIVSEDVGIKRSISKGKMKTPPSITARDYVNFKRQEEQKKQEDKKRKEDKKNERLQNKKRKMESNKKKSNEMCSVCNTKTNWKIGSKWIGCSVCTNWCHKTCISDDVLEMNNEQIKDLFFVCPSCE